MSASDDTDGVIPRPLSEDDADRLLAGRPVAPGADAGGISALLAALRTDGTADELDDTDDFVAHLATVVRSSTPGVILLSDRPARRRSVGRITGKVAVLAATTLLSAGAAAAATGTLPDPIQRGVSSTFSRIGLDLPSPADDEREVEDRPTSGDGTTDGGGTTPSTTPAVGGLCTAYRAGGSLDGTARDTLAAAADDAGTTVDGLCNPAAGPGSSTPDGTPGSNPSDTAPGKPGTNPSDTAPGNAGSTPADTAPGNPGTNPSDSAPGRTGTNPSDTAPGQSDTSVPRGSPPTDPPGSSGSTPGDTAPGNNGTTPGDTAPGKVGTSPGDTAPGRTQPTAKGRPTTTTTTTG